MIFPNYESVCCLPLRFTGSQQYAWPGEGHRSIKLSVVVINMRSHHRNHSQSSPSLQAPNHLLNYLRRRNSLLILEMFPNYLQAHRSPYKPTRIYPPLFPFPLLHLIPRHPAILLLPPYIPFLSHHARRKHHRRQIKNIPHSRIIPILRLIQNRRNAHISRTQNEIHPHVFHPRMVFISVFVTGDIQCPCFGDG